MLNNYLRTGKEKHGKDQIPETEDTLDYQSFTRSSNILTCFVAVVVALVVAAAVVVVVAVVVAGALCWAAVVAVVLPCCVAVFFCDNAIEICARERANTTQQIENAGETKSSKALRWPSDLETRMRLHLVRVTVDF